jgi:hypothetical protein
MIMCDREYGIIREQGEYMDPVPLSPEENAVVNESNSESSDK